jgi:periplasmic protein TonB
MEAFPKKNDKASRRARVLPLAVGLALGIPLLALALSLLFTKTDPGKHKMVTQITLVAPPPPPKPEEKPPDPPKVKDEVKLDEPKPQDEPKPAAEQPPAGPLGVDAQGTGPGDGFGLAGRPGGRDIIGSGAGGGLGLTLFGSTTARHIAQELARDPKLRSSSYQIEIRIWLSKEGRFEREEIVRGTGDRELDALIRAGLDQLSAVQSPVPQNLPQPLRIRVTSSDA